MLPVTDYVTSDGVTISLDYKLSYCVNNYAFLQQFTSSDVVILLGAPGVTGVKGEMGEMGSPGCKGQPGEPVE